MGYSFILTAERDQSVSLSYSIRSFTGGLVGELAEWLLSSPALVISSSIGTTVLSEPLMLGPEGTLLASVELLLSTSMKLI